MNAKKKMVFPPLKRAFVWFLVLCSVPLSTRFDQQKKKEKRKKIFFTLMWFLFWVFCSQNKPTIKRILIILIECVEYLFVLKSFSFVLQIIYNNNLLFIANSKLPVDSYAWKLFFSSNSDNLEGNQSNRWHRIYTIRFQNNKDFCKSDRTPSK